MLTTVYHILWQNESRVVFVIDYVFHSTDVSASCRVRNGCTVMPEIAVQSINRKIKRELKWKKISTQSI